MQHYAKTVYAVVECPSVYGVKTAKHRITQSMPYNSAGTLVFNAKDVCKIRPGSPAMGAPNAGGVGKISDFFSTSDSLYLEKGMR